MVFGSRTYNVSIYENGHERHNCETEKFTTHSTQGLGWILNGYFVHIRDKAQRKVTVCCPD